MSRAFDNIEAYAKVESRRSLISSMFDGIQQYDVIAREIDGRRIRVRDDHWVIDFASCNYLGLDLDAEVSSGVAASIKRWGVHPSWCRLVASPQIYVDLEERLAALVGTEASVIIPTVTLISIGVIPALVGRSGVLLLDKSGHESMYEGARIARDNGATLAGFPQGNLSALRSLLHAHRDNPRKVVLVDGVYSANGDHADIEGLTRLAAEYDAVIYVDDAHGFGVVGERPSAARPFGERGNGIVKHFAGGYDNVLYVGGCSKAYSSLAAFVACSNKMQRFVKTFATPYDLSGPSPTASLATLLQGLAVNDVRGDAIRDRLWALTQRVVVGLRGLGFEVDNRTGFPIVSARIGDSALLEKCANLLFERGILVTVCLFPRAKRGEETFRITVTAANTDDEVDELLVAFAAVHDVVKASTGGQLQLQ